MLRSKYFLRISLLMVVLLGSVHAVNSQTFSKRQLAKMLRKMYKVDQKARTDYIELENKHAVSDSLAVKKAGRRMTYVDSIHYITLQEIFKAVGYPDVKESGGSGPSYFWLLVQHQDRHPTFQDSVLTAMKPVVDSGQVSGVLYAMLTDRVRINTGRLQVYGSQVHLNADSSAYEMLPCEDPENVNARRKSVGLAPIEVYLESFNKDLKKPD